MNQQNFKKPAKNQPKIHRRKNQQINKDYECPVETCQKAYGSYAALYTHIKNKHPAVKPPNMPSQTKTKQTTAQPGRPKIKKNEDDKEGSESPRQFNKFVCKICLKQECECVEVFNTEQKDKIIQIMGDDKFINFTNQIGQLGDSTFTWVRRTEDDYLFKPFEQITKEINQFNAKNNASCKLSDLLKNYLSFSSKFWDKSNIDELYGTIYAIMAFENYQVTLNFIKQNKYPKMQSCIEANPNQFKRFQTMIRLI